MKRALIIGVVSLCAFAIAAPAAQGATRIRQVQVPITSGGTTGPMPVGTLTLKFVFQNKRSSRHRFTPRRLIRIEFSNLPLQCANTPSEGRSQLLLTRSLDVGVKVTKTPPPHASRPKPGRFAFRFTYDFSDFAGVLQGTIDKPNTATRPRALRSQGSLRIDDLDSNPGHTNCSTQGPKQWGGLPVTGV